MVEYSKALAIGPAPPIIPIAFENDLILPQFLIIPVSVSEISGSICSISFRINKRYDFQLKSSVLIYNILSQRMIWFPKYFIPTRMQRYRMLEAFADRILESKKPHLYSIILQKDESDFQDSLAGEWLLQGAVINFPPVHSKNQNDNPSALFFALTAMLLGGENYFVWCRANRRIAKLQKELETIHIELREADPILKNKVDSVFQKQMNILNLLQRESVKGMVLQSLPYIPTLV